MLEIPNNIPEDWRKIFEQEFSKNYFIDLSNYLEDQLNQGKAIYPEKDLWFKAFIKTPLHNVKCVIIGQDPYYSSPTQPHGLAFSVPENVPPPPSLKNIKKEIVNSFDTPCSEHGNLSKWSNEGVLLLNASLTVEANKPGSHLNKGWLQFTKAIISHINDSCEHVVFLSWGGFAHTLTDNVNTNTHKVISTTHPSPLGAYKASKTAPSFIGSKCFLLANNWLEEQGITPINWSI